MQFTGDDFSGQMRLVHCLVRQHGLAYDVADGWATLVRHLDVDVGEAAVRHGLVGGNLPAYG